MRKMFFALVAAVFLLVANAAQAGSLITAQELASRLGMTCNADPSGSRCTLSDGVNEVIICAGMYNLLVNSQALNMDSRAVSRGGSVCVPDTVLGRIRVYIRPPSNYRAQPQTVRAAWQTPRLTQVASVPATAAAPPVRSYTPTYAPANTPTYTQPSYTPMATPSYGLQTIKRTRFKVVIDPGHGGKDPGAVGLSGLREKTVNLGIGLALRDILQFRGANVVMTRQDDNFVELEERAAICNREQGDVYVSIHANASTNRSTTGSEIYFVDDQREFTAPARGVAAARTMDIAPWCMGCNASLDLISKEVLFGALLEEYRIESRDLAAHVMGQLGGHMISYGRGIYGNKGLRVLRFARCPGVLVEVGFLSNPQTEQMLQQDSYRRSLAESVGEGIMHFKVAQDQTAWNTR